MTHLSLFSGIGGLDIAAEWAGFTTVGQCEWADYPTKVLEKHWPDVPRWRDIRTLTGDSFHERTALRTVDVISGGFPCQPFSVAGKRRGSEDDRYLWPEMLRVIEELKPRWVVGENVAGIVNLALDTVLSDLEAKGYTAGAVVIPACAVDAPHRRDRVAIVAHAGREPSQGWHKNAEGSEGPPRCKPTPCGSDAAHSHCDNSDARRPEPAGQQRQAGLADGGGDVENPDSIGCQQPRVLSGQSRGAEFIGAGEDCSDWPSSNMSKNVANAKSNIARGLPIGTGEEVTGFVGRREPEPEPERPDWRPIEPGLGRWINGFSRWVAGFGGLSDGAKARADEILRNVRDTDAEKALQWTIGRFQGVSAEEVLLALMCEYEEESNESGIPKEGCAISEKFMRNLWRVIETARSPRRRRYNQQYAREYSDALHALSQYLPSLMPQAWANGTWEDDIPRVATGIANRVDRLKCLGNAVVPQQFYPVFAAIAQIEKALAR